MKKRILGRTGMEVSEIAFGGVEIGMPYANGNMPSESESIHLLHKAVAYGINFFDTARMYGNSETLMGKAFAGIRSKIIIATKCVHLLDKEGILPPASMLENRILQSLEESLHALKTDYLDVFMLHQANLDILSNDTIIDLFLKIKKDGKTRAIGVSTYTVEETDKSIESGIWDVIQLPFNLMDQKQRTCFEDARKAQIGLIVRSVLFRGLLSGQPLNLHPELREVEEHIRKYHPYLNDTCPSLPSLATKFALSYREVASVLVGIDKLDYLEKAIKTADGKYLNTSLLSEIESMAYPEPGFLNLHQWVHNGWIT